MRSIVNVQKLYLITVFLFSTIFLLNCGKDNLLKDLEIAQRYFDRSTAPVSEIVDLKLVESKEAFTSLGETDEGIAKQRTFYLIVNAGKAKNQISKYFEVCTDGTCTVDGNLQGSAKDRDLETRRLLTETYGLAVMGKLGISFMNLAGTFLNTSSTSSDPWDTFAGLLPEELYDSEPYTTDGVLDEAAYDAATTKSIKSIENAQTVVDAFLVANPVESKTTTATLKLQDTDITESDTATSSSEKLTKGEGAALNLISAFLSYASFSMVTGKVQETGKISTEDAAAFIKSIEGIGSLLSAAGFGGESVNEVIDSAVSDIGSDPDAVQSFLCEQLSSSNCETN